MPNSPPPSGNAHRRHKIANKRIRISLFVRGTADEPAGRQTRRLPRYEHALNMFLASTSGSKHRGKTGVEPRIGLALGGGFARGIAHAGVLKIMERYGIPIHCITGVSAGSIVAAAYASGASPEEIGDAGCAMRFSDVARWSIGRLGLAGNERMRQFLQRLLKTHRFEHMRIPLGIVATDLSTGAPVPFAKAGPVFRSGSCKLLLSWTISPRSPRRAHAR
jgi:hypothetical protein